MTTDRQFELEGAVFALTEQLRRVTAERDELAKVRDENAGRIAELEGERDAAIRFAQEPRRVLEAIGAVCSTDRDASRRAVTTVCHPVLSEVLRLRQERDAAQDLIQSAASRAERSEEELEAALSRAMLRRRRQEIATDRPEEHETDPYHAVAEVIYGS